MNRLRRRGSEFDGPRPDGGSADERDWHRDLQGDSFEGLDLSSDPEDARRSDERRRSAR
jgi:hypothetical protein